MSDGERAHRVNPNFGLTHDEVQKRIAAGERNTKPPHITKTNGQIIRENVCTLFNALNIAIALALILVESYENLLFLGVILSNLVIGIYQQLNAKRMVEKLSLLHSVKAKVRRGGEDIFIEVDDLVKNDILLLSLGNEIPADSIVISGDIEVNESQLTGESDAIGKSSGDMLLSGSYVVSGSCIAEVVHVGAQNYATKLVSEAKAYKKTDTNLMRALRRIIRFTGAAVVPLGALVFLGAYYGADASVADAVVTTSASMIGMIPSGLMLLTSVSLAVGVIVLSRKNTLVRDIYSIETLSRVDMLCLDKTGTLTTGLMEVDSVAINADDAHSYLLAIVNAFEADNATSRALRDYVKHEEVSPVSTLAFSSSRKYSAAAFDGMGTVYLGAPSHVGGEMCGELSAIADKKAADGLRVLMLAVDENTLDASMPPSKPKTLALIFIREEIRIEAKDTLAFFQKEGVNIKLISGDDERTVSSIAQTLHLEGKSVNCLELHTEEEVRAAALEYSVFARVSPVQKRQLICALKDAGHTVAMTGDGVNDILALKDADCSIAMAAGSDAAKQVSHLVLLDNNFASLTKTVMEGRRVINNVTRTSSLFLTKTMFSFALTFFAVGLGVLYPFTPIQLSLLSTVAIGMPAFFLALEANRSRIKGDFMVNVLSKALPGAILVTLYALFANFLASQFTLDEATRGTLVVYLAGTAALAVLLRVCMPLTKSRAILFGVMATAYFFGAHFLRDLLAIAAFPPWFLPMFLFAAALSFPLITLFAWVRRRIVHMLKKLRKDRILNKNDVIMDAQITKEDTKMYVVVGLGNPGVAYQNSRHNAGFLAIDRLADELDVTIDKRAHKGKLKEVFIGSTKVILLKPETYMNLSGESVSSLMNFYKVPIENLIVLYDDIDIGVGELRIRARGSAGTHNGMRSIISHMGGDDGFARVRIGVGKQAVGRELASHVLGKPPEEEREKLEEAYKAACDAVRMIVSGDISGAQGKYNKKKKKKEVVPSEGEE